MTSRTTPKTKPFGIRLTEHERRELERRAGEMALGSYVKSVLFADGQKRRTRGARAPVRDHQALAQVLACLGQSRLSETMERLSQAAESGTLYVDDDVPVEIKRACQDIVTMRLLLMRSLGFQINDDLFDDKSLSQSFTRVARPDDDWAAP
jgi:hypothetical protein